MECIQLTRSYKTMSRCKITQAFKVFKQNEVIVAVWAGRRRRLDARVSPAASYYLHGYLPTIRLIRCYFHFSCSL